MREFKIIIVTFLKSLIMPVIAILILFAYRYYLEWVLDMQGFWTILLSVISFVFEYFIIVLYYRALFETKIFDFDTIEEYGCLITPFIIIPMVVTWLFGVGMALIPYGVLTAMNVNINIIMLTISLDFPIILAVYTLYKIYN